MSVMDSTTPAPNHHEPVPVNRFALFSETLLAGVLVLVLSLPLVTIPAAYAAGITHLERHLSGRDDSVRGLWNIFRTALRGSWKIGITTAAAVVVIVLNLMLAWVGQLPGREVVLPATVILAAAAAILLLRTAAAWSDFTGSAADGRETWRSALAAGQALSVKDWTGSLLLASALFAAVVFVWMLVALFVVVPGTLILAAAAVKLRSSR
ncbi:Poxvirus protein I5 [Pseudarthrobacter phenanthrenivorans]|uniref:Poxvirus protein I5 n=1 Tax=Pseudarthrobacter phenanthrenivorans TaxID=361575 RepID=A0A3B0FL75_PSEPS|nr:Poxvirus protein I5 [Pseudarthrobacter phenanthrenivorans]RKO20605.1 Poxvirus protein I5 [Pseudarthrobacter phenanthrenivorans]TPV52398.1 Poxvirus protein I5 [Pseudarthrobacter phenanthrenivorans]